MRCPCNPKQALIPTEFISTGGPAPTIFVAAATKIVARNPAAAGSLFFVGSGSAATVCGWFQDFYDSAKLMNAEPPPELKGFHTKTMLHAFLVFLIPLGAWMWGYHRQEAYSADDRLQSALNLVFLVGVGLFMLTILIKATVSLPACPECHRKMKEIETISIAEKPIFRIKSSQRWRIVECPHCKIRFRIPGLSIG
jgi:hypothetical protein